MESMLIKCSFCGKAESQVVTLIKGPGVNICNECVALCDDILRESPQGEVGLGRGADQNQYHWLSTLFDRAARAVENSDPGLALELRAAAKRVRLNVE